MIPTCKEAVRLIASGEGTALGRLGLSLHLLMCEKCRRYKSQIDRIGEAARQLWRGSGDDEAIARLRDRILEDDPSDDG